MSDNVPPQDETTSSDASHPPTAWELGKNVFGKHSSDRTDLSENVSHIARKKIHERARKQREKREQQ